MKKKLNKTGEMKLECQVGYLSKSPCRDCKLKNQLPDCFNNCKIISGLQAVLNDVISCSNNYSELETFSLSYQSF
ncbi:hypothetical protein [Desulfobacterium sp. N47]|uniref:Uncharacterized protein n=1 Tax=uncultured Desulfobacterium sp. TaxID=201089 RepID=E1YGC7_9BACT|nr:unknown protein [uncultured Desulfobacterium sp.]